MRLKKLEVKGFKSFRDKTVLDFPRQFTGVIGPNGSGKSNITEAVCFVLGQSRGLRAQNMVELIYNGGVGGRPAKKAVVSLTLADDSGKSHRITRIIDREGHSIYKLGDKRTTRENIVSLLGDNEYNIIMQDDVTKIVKMRPVERRMLVDDLCGIREYDEKREKALKELEKVEGRISETHLILGEKQEYLKELQKERKEALSYQDTRDLLQKSKATLLFKDLESQRRRRERLEEINSNSVREREDLESSRSVNDNALEDAKKKLSEANAKIREREELHGEARLAETHGAYLRKKDQLEYAQGRIDESSRELSERRERIKGIETELRGVDGQLDEARSRKESASKKLEKYVGEAGFSILDEERVLRDELGDNRSEYNKLKAIIESQSAELEEIEGERGDLDRRMRELHHEEGELKKLLESLEREYAEQLTQFQQKESKNNEANGKVDEYRRLLESRRLELASAKSEFSALQGALGGVKDSVSALMKVKNVLPGLKGPVFQLGTVKEGEYELALQIAAGARMHHVVVEDVDTAAKCIKYLRDKRVGRATFLPLDKIKSKTSRKCPKEAIGFARDFISCKREFRRVFEFIFGDTIIVKDLDTARSIGLGPYRMVTLEGDLLERTGVVTGGFVKKRPKAGFQDLERLEENITRLEDDVKTLEKQLEQRITAAKEWDERTRSARNILYEKQSALDESKTDLRVVSEKRNSVREKSESNEKKIEELKNRIEEGKTSALAIEKKISALEKDLEKMLAGYDEGDTGEANRLRDSVTELEVAEARLVEKRGHLMQEKKSLEETLGGLGEKRDAAMAERELLEKQARELDKKLEKQRSENKSLSREIEGLQRERDGLENLLTELSEKNAGIQRRLEEISAGLNNYLVEQAKIDTRMEDLEREYRRYEGVELLDESVKSLTENVEKLEERMIEFGSVNMRAIESYDVVKNEFDETMKRLDVLKKERSSIYEFMEKIEKKKTTRFMEAFNGVKENFEKIFTKLTDGKGTLVLTNPSNVSESGLLIKASPAGKKVMSLDALSGGEKAVTSASFLLAIQKYKPSYFYIIDELDAALDDFNSLKLARMLAESKTQFILVTHNNEMMKFIDSAIGVTMIDGVSQIVGVDIPRKSS